VRVRGACNNGWAIPPLSIREPDNGERNGEKLRKGEKTPTRKEKKNKEKNKCDGNMRTLLSFFPFRQKTSKKEKEKRNYSEKKKKRKKASSATGRFPTTDRSTEVRSITNAGKKPKRERFSFLTEGASPDIKKKGGLAGKEEKKRGYPPRDTFFSCAIGEGGEREGGDRRVREKRPPAFVERGKTKRGGEENKRKKRRGNPTRKQEREKKKARKKKKRKTRSCRDGLVHGGERDGKKKG